MAYKKQVDGYMRNAFAMAFPFVKFRSPGEIKFFIKIVSPRVEILKEYEIYDFNGILGSVGGSLGLFVGFSFLDCLLTGLNSTFAKKISVSHA